MFPFNRESVPLFPLNKGGNNGNSSLTICSQIRGTDEEQWEQWKAPCLIKSSLMENK
jgi:hypothetical protein